VTSITRDGAIAPRDGDAGAATVPARDPGCTARAGARDAAADAGRVTFDGGFAVATADREGDFAVEALLPTSLAPTALAARAGTLRGDDRLVARDCVCRDAARAWLFDIGRSLTFEKRVQGMHASGWSTDPRRTLEG
jgi:hypothetical protein